MLRGHWCVVVALAGLGALFVAYGIGWYNATLNYPKQERYQSYTYPAEQEANAWTAVAKKTRSTENRQPCEKPKGHDESDLCAQWKAARAAESSALWTERGFWIGLASVIGLGATIILTLRATEAAQRSARAAEKAVESAERPHMLLGDITLSDLSSPDLDGALDFTYRIINHGAGPGWIKRSAIQLISEAEIPEEPILDFDNKNIAVSPGGWWGSVQPNKIRFQPETITDILSGEEILVAFFAIEYVNANNSTHVHNFAHRYLVDQKRFYPIEHPFWKYT